MFCHLYWFAAATQGNFFLFWNLNFHVIKLESESGESESAMQKYAIESGIRIRRFFGRIAIPDKFNERNGVIKCFSFILHLVFF